MEILKDIPRLSEIASCRGHESGERIIVRTTVPLMPQEYRSIAKSIEKFLNANPDILFVTLTQVEIINVREGDLEPVVLAGRTHIKPEDIDSKQIHVGCSHVDLSDCKFLTVSYSEGFTGAHQRLLFEAIKKWSGGRDVVEVAR